jgi:glycosyltransferase involved in cell wall biosynthesis
MRVVVASHGYSEAERFKLLDAIGREHEVTLLVPQTIWTSVFGDFHAPEQTDQVRVVSNRTIKFGSHYLFRPSLRTYRALRPDVLHVEYDPWTPEFWSIVAPMMILFPRTPIVLFTKKNTRHIPRGPVGVIERLLTRLGLGRVKLILAVSSKAGAIFSDLGYGHKKIEVQGHMPIDDEVFSPATQAVTPAPRPFTVGFVGSISPAKGLPTLIEAVAGLRSRLGEDVQLELVGPMRDFDLAHSIAAHEWIHYRGPKQNRDVPEFLAGLDAFVMPSAVLPDHEEHDGQALLEAMAMELGCIGSRSGVMPELIQSGDNGLLFEPDDADGLADQLEKLAADPEMRHRLGVRARQTALARTGLDTLVEQRLAAYREVRVA